MLNVTPVVDQSGSLARLALALSLATVGDFLQVIDLLADDPDLLDREPRAALLLAFAYASADRHNLAESTARMLLRGQHSDASRFIRGRARLMIAYTRVVRRIGTFSASRSPASRREKFVAVVGMLTSALSLIPLYAKAIQISGPRHQSDFRRYDALDFGADYAEHAIRVSAFLLRLMPRQVRTVAQIVLPRMTDRLSFNVGYMRGVLNGYRYRARATDPQP